MITMMRFPTSFPHLLIAVTLMLLCRPSEETGSVNIPGYENTPERIFKECLKTNLCIAPGQKVPPEDADCIERADCKRLIGIGGGFGQNVSVPEDQVILELYSKERQTMGFAFTRKKVGLNDTYVVICSKDGKKDTHLHHIWTNSKYRNSTEISSAPHIQLLDGKTTDKTVYCMFSMKKKFSITNPYTGKKVMFDLNKKYHLASGWNDTLQINGVFLNPRVEQAPEPVLMTTRHFPDNRQLELFKYHGVCMIAVWLGLVGVGNFIGDFYKDVYDKTYSWTCKMKLWLWLHTGIILLAAIPMVFALSMAIYAQSGWTALPSTTDRFHKYGGYTSVLLYILNTTWGIILAIADQRAPRLYQRQSQSMQEFLRFTYPILSHANFLLSALLMAQSPQMHFTVASCSFTHTTLGWVLLYGFVICVLMPLYNCWGPKFAFGYDEHIPPPVALTVTPRQSVKFAKIIQLTVTQMHPKTKRFKTVVLVVFTITSIIVTGTLMALLNWPFDTCHFEEKDPFFGPIARQRRGIVR